MKRLIIVLLISASILSSAQVAPPKRQSKHHHIQDEADNFQQRYEDLKCALVIIQSGNRLGTGFYVNGSGDVATASHVLGDQLINPRPDGRIEIRLVQPITYTVKNSKEEFSVPASGVSLNADDWKYDLAVLRTGRPAPCWLQIANDKDVKPGQHVITMGFPGLAFGSLSLYSGIISARLRSDLIAGTTIQGNAFKRTNENFRVQMPISTGISGSPIIDDDNRAIAVVTQAGAWSGELEKLTEKERIREQNPPPAAVNQQDSPDLSVAVAQLALLFHDWMSPGYGDAVPLSYLATKVQQDTQTPSSRAH
jgi:S1-C subfamily serine protease